MKNFIQRGGTLTLAAPYDVLSGQGVLIGQIFGVAASDALSAADVDVVTEGVFDLAKPSAAIFTVGAPVYFDTATLTVRSGNDDDSNSAATNEALIGVAVAAAGAGAVVARVKIGQPVSLV